MIHQGALGDVVAAFPALLKLKAAFGPIDIICQNNIGSLVRQLGIADNYFPLEAAAFASMYSSHVDPVVKKILFTYSKVILFSGSRSLEKTLLSITDSSIYRIPPRPDSGHNMHISRHILLNLVRYGLLEGSDNRVFCRLSPGVHADRRDPNYHPIKIFIHPGSGSRKKCWPISNFIKIASLIEAKGRRPEFILGPAEHDFFDVLSRRKTLKAKIHKIDALAELAVLLKTGGGFIGNDSGVSHLSAFLGLPTVAVFGPSDPDIWAPVGRSVEIVKSRCECSPCFDSGTVGCEKIECFRDISCEDVLAAFYRLVPFDQK